MSTSGVAVAAFVKYGNSLVLFLAIRSICSFLFAVQLRREQYKYRSITELASFPGSAQLSIACSTEKALNLFFQFFVSTWGEPRNEAMTECELSNKYDRELCM